MFDHFFIQTVLSALQIYVGLDFLEVVPGFAAGGFLGKTIGVALMLAGIGTAFSCFTRYISEKNKVK